MTLYFDYAASTPVDPVVADAMAEAFPTGIELASFELTFPLSITESLK